VKIKQKDFVYNIEAKVLEEIRDKVKKIIDENK